MLVKDEADIIGYTLDYLAGQVDGIFVIDDGSTDATSEILLERRGTPIYQYQDPDPGYWQSRKTTMLAMKALAIDYQWVVPVDADEVWYAPDGRRLADYLGGMPPDVQIVTADLYNHIPTGVDPPASCSRCGGTGEEPLLHDDEYQGHVACDACQGHVEPNPLRRIGWRQRERAPLGKVCARLRPDLVIEAGNHSARTSGTALAVPGLVVRHFSWRSPQQYLRKIRNGSAAYAATDLPPGVGAHWRMWDEASDEQVEAHFREWFFAEMPRKDGSLMFDPAPVG